MNPVKLPSAGMLIAPKHKLTSFCTILEVDFHDGGECLSVFYLRIADNIKIRTARYPTVETFWKYYEEQ